MAYHSDSLAFDFNLAQRDSFSFCFFRSSVFPARIDAPPGGLGPRGEKEISFRGWKIIFFPAAAAAVAPSDATESFARISEAGGIIGSVVSPLRVLPA